MRRNDEDGLMLTERARPIKRHWTTTGPKAAAIYIILFATTT